MLEKSDIVFIKEIIKDDKVNGNQISFRTSYTQPYINFRLKYLLNTNIIQGNKIGRKYIYFINDELRMHIKNYTNFENYINQLENKNEKL